MRHKQAATGAAHYLRQSLHKHWPAVRFRVTHPGAAYRVFWIDGPTVSQVRALIRRAAFAHGAEFHRDYSDRMIRKALEQVRERFQVPAQLTLRDFRSGRLVRMRADPHKGLTAFNNLQQQVGRTLDKLA